MTACYIIRFDDICPTMNWSVWNRIERAVNDLGIKPIIAVVPDNRDPLLQVGSPDLDFWANVRKWQESGWIIAMHGYRHVCDSRRTGIVGFSRNSEFAGFTLEEQRFKILEAVKIFSNQGVAPQAWIAPNHSFDLKTLKVLRESGIEIISDGLYMFPGKDAEGFFWLPQQLWHFRSLPFGVWTICLHFNWWDESHLQRFLTQLIGFKERIVCLKTVLKFYGNRRLTILDGCFAFALRNLIRIKFKRSRKGKY